MKTKFLSLLVVCLMAVSAFSQSNLNNYKYIIIPKKYDFLKQNDQYQLNSLTEFLFNKYGFVAFMEGEDYPDDLNANRCLALTSNALKDSSMFKTKLQIELKNCNGTVIYTTEVGESREKDYNKAYPEALRNAFKELQTINYKYIPVNNAPETVAKEVKNQNEVVNQIEQLKAEIENLKKEKDVKNIEVLTTNPESKAEIVVENAIKDTKSIQEGVQQVLYAQAVENGFQLVDSSPKVVYKIKNTSLKDVYLVEGKNATLYKKGDDWVLEYYENNVLKQEVLNIKF
ncbi:hypothetical protein [Confluentibacter sediminis]|uniref:hypothetical protein n=1 Tax=Confluentibacter sediminis TaxID=2219045 RepID=UPI000DAB3F6C|nr:hypothetical protein [Confluentibacter sediminis]